MAKKIICKYVLNINNCTVTPRTQFTDANPIIFRKIDDETATAIVRGKVRAIDVIEAIEKKERAAADFNWREYDAKRRAAEKQLNVSSREMIPVNDDQAGAGEGGGDTGSGDVITMKDLGMGGAPSGKGGKPTNKPNRTNKPSGTQNGGTQGGEQKGNKPPEKPNDAAGAGGTDAGSGSAGGEGAGAGAGAAAGGEGAGSGEGAGEGAGTGEGAGDGDEVQY